MFCLVDIAKYVMLDDTVVYMCFASYEIIVMIDLQSEAQQGVCSNGRGGSSAWRRPRNDDIDTSVDVSADHSNYYHTRT